MTAFRLTISAANANPEERAADTARCLASVIRLEEALDTLKAHLAALHPHAAAPLARVWGEELDAAASPPPLPMAGDLFDGVAL